ncbi:MULTISPECIES: tape measure protein [unclassified Clostridium]|uniref:tape measure protein n=1 Tax=unclassified Clostridium TaxID=2614128 RepID=UPI001FAB22CB|nr:MULTISPECIES: tape measure protein [unclassified Clostridium]
MAYDGTLKFDTSMDASGFQKGANKLGDIVKGLGVFRLMEKGFQVVADSMDRAVSRYDTLDRFPRIMEQMGFSAEDASSSINKLSDGVQGLPTALDEITGSTQRIASMTGDLEGATDLSLALNNAFLASGSSADAASRGLEQYMQIISRGKPEMEDWKTIQETMPYALQQVAESFGFAGTSATRDFYSALKDGEITVEEMNTRFIELSTATGGFAELAKTATGGINTAFTNLRNRTAAGLADIIKAIDTGFSKTRFKSIENIINTMSTGIKKALTGVAQAFGFVAENSEVILPLLVGIGATVAGWKIGEVLTGLIGKFQTTSMWVTRLAVSQTGLTAAEASFATASAIANAGLGVKEVLVGVLTGKIGLATAAQWAWNTAMNANPIGVIIGLIALLVTACISLNAVFMNSLSPAYQQQKAEIDAMNESMDAHISAMDDAIKKGEEAVTTAKAEAITNQQLVDRLTALTAIENRSAEEKAELADVTAQLAKEFPELNLQYEEEQDNLVQSSEAIAEYVAAKNKIAETTALQERANEEQSAYNQLQADMIVLKEKALAINEDENLSWVEKNFLLEEIWGQYQENDKAIKDHKKTVEAAQKAVDKASIKEEQATVRVTEALNAKTESGGSLLNKYAHDYGMTTDQILADLERQEIGLEEWGKTMESQTTKSGMGPELLGRKWNMAASQVEAACRDWGMNYEEFNDYMKSIHTEAGEDINDLAAQWGVSVTEIQNWIAMNESDVQGWSDMMEEDWENYRKAVQENVDTIINGMEPLPTKMDYNLKQMTQTLSKNAEKYKAWKDKMAQVSSQLTPEVLQYLSDLGPGTTQILDEIIKDTSGKKAQELNEAYGKVGEAAKEGINEQQPAVKAAFTDLADGGAEGLTESTAAVDAAGEIAKDVATTISNGDYSGLTDNMSASIREGLGSVKAAMQILQDVVGDILKAMDKDAQGSAANMMAGINSTIITRSYPAQSSAASVAKGIVTALGVMVTTAKGVMVNTMNGMLVAMNEKAPILYDKANTIATKISETMEKALEVGSPSKVMIRLFGWVMQGIYDGMESMEGLVFGEADTIATGIADRLDISKDMARSMVGNLRSVTTAGNLGGSALTMQTAAAGGAPGGVNYYTNLTQYNTSPKALSPAELTQEAQDMLRRARWQLP